MEAFFQVPDYNGVLVTLSRRVWEGKILSSDPSAHPEVGPYLDEIRRAVVEPDIEFLNFSALLEEAFGQEMKFIGSEKGERILLLPRVRWER